jgi:hypothetical protein
MPFTAIRRRRGRRWTDGRWGSGRREGDGNDGRDGVSRTLGDGRIPWVLVDNKSAAEIGKRCLLLIGGQRPRAVSVR